ncbi:MAG: hypothetical protein M3071_03635, partial [Actinomycetota bacterium]|nr:hypothetical protein [Actinomycetota bacterium]
SPPPAALVLVADRFPASPTDSASVPAGARVEAARRPDAIDPRAARDIPVSYREDDGTVDRAWALAQLAIRHPVRTARSLVEKRNPQARFSTSLSALAPAALRLARDPGARVRALDPPDAHPTARRLAALAGATLEEPTSP